MRSGLCSFQFRGSPSKENRFSKWHMEPVLVPPGPGSGAAGRHRHCLGTPRVTQLDANDGLDENTSAPPYQASFIDLRRFPPSAAKSEAAAASARARTAVSLT